MPSEWYTWQTRSVGMGAQVPTTVAHLLNVSGRPLCGATSDRGSRGLGSTRTRWRAVMDEPKCKRCQKLVAS